MLLISDQSEKPQEALVSRALALGRLNPVVLGFETALRMFTLGTSSRGSTDIGFCRRTTFFLLQLVGERMGGLILTCNSILYPVVWWGCVWHTLFCFQFRYSKLELSMFSFCFVHVSMRPSFFSPTFRGVSRNLPPYSVLQLCYDMQTPYKLTQ